MSEPNVPLLASVHSSSSAEHPLSSALHPSARRTSSYSLLAPHPHDSSSHFRRPHAATISAPRRKTQHAEAELLGLEASHLRESKTTLSSPATVAQAIMEAEHLNITRSSSTNSRTLFSSLSKEELVIVNKRFDLMSDLELSEYLSLFGSSQSSTQPSASHSPHPLLDPASLTPQNSSQSTPSLIIDDQDSQIPLFPPSPPGHVKPEIADHPLRVLSRAIRELQEEIARLEEDNQALRLAHPHPVKTADQLSIHDGIADALSSSLAPDSLLNAPVPPQTISSIAQSIRSSSPAPSVRSHLSQTSRRTKSPLLSHPSTLPTASPPIPHAPLPDPDPMSTPVAQGKKNNRTSWTSGLWVWSNGKPRRPRKGSIGSIASFGLGIGSPAPAGVPEENEAPEEEDEYAWRKGDGGSSPAFKAIFLATRIITPDPSSILVPTSVSSKSLIAYLAHSLVSNARDEGIVAREPPGRRQSRDLSRSRATSIASQLSPDLANATPTRERGYGDQALAATASLGRTLLSSVSTATMRARAMGEDIGRPSLLSRTSHSRSFPTVTSLAAPQLSDSSPLAQTSPNVEIPPPSVELSSIVPDDARPPTMVLSRQNLGSFFQSTKLKTATRFDNGETPLTDRYGFIYDIQHASMLKDASAAGAVAPASLTGNVLSTEDGWVLRRKDVDSRSESSPRPSFDCTRSEQPSPRISLDVPLASPTSAHTPTVSRSSIDRGRTVPPPSLVINPTAPITAKESLTVSTRGSTSLHSTATSTPLTTATTSTTMRPIDSRRTVSSLLDRLTDMHDAQQKERTAEWDAFLRKRSKSRSQLPNGAKTSGALSEDLRWGSGLIGLSQMGLAKDGQEDWKAFAALVRKGIPLAYRSDIWAECSGAKDLMVPGEYREILKVHEGDVGPFDKEIEKDVGRTFPGNVFFGGDGPGVAKLRRVLIAYSWLVYIHTILMMLMSGMNMLAATLLLTHSDEEQAYWVLLSIIERLLPTDFFAPSLLASRADQAVLSDLVALHLPKVDEKLSEVGLNLASLTFGWFLSLFTDCLPVETLFRVWDVFFVEGHAALFRIAIAILRLAEPDILASEGVSGLFAAVNANTARLWSADKLIHLQHAIKSVVKNQDIAARCHEKVLELQAGLEDPPSDATSR
ncbi:hypothetical protein M231_02455 [Tremella mesenterica]|uniref:Rab-GAP TBC domain-containing protein n=1 Tax=Tremella mesenterica TaxID=5217 RepID=A0A4Q1BQH0_TREME|nr:hypothetical protein M231_02455 [Tremella mesenterica]